MAYYKLVSSGRSDTTVDEIILSRNDQGEVEKAISVNTSVELSDEQLSEAQKIAGQLDYKVVEADAPQDVPAQSQPPGADVVGESPVLAQTGPSSTEIDQSGTAAATEQARTSPPADRSR